MSDNTPTPLVTRPRFERNSPQPPRLPTHAPAAPGPQNTIDRATLAKFRIALALQDAWTRNNPGKTSVALPGPNAADRAKLLSDDNDAAASLLKRVLDRNQAAFIRLLGEPVTTLMVLPTTAGQPKPTPTLILRPARKGGLTFGFVLENPDFVGEPTPAMLASRREPNWATLRPIATGVYLDMLRDVPISVLGWTLEPFLRLAAGALVVDVLAPGVIDSDQAAATRVSVVTDEEPVPAAQGPAAQQPGQCAHHHSVAQNELAYTASSSVGPPAQSTAPPANPAVAQTPSFVASLPAILAMDAHGLMSMPAPPAHEVPTLPPHYIHPMALRLGRPLPLHNADPLAPHPHPHPLPHPPHQHARPRAPSPQVPNQQLAALEASKPEPISPRTAAFEVAYLDFGSDDEVEEREDEDEQAVAVSAGPVEAAALAGELEGAEVEAEGVAEVAAAVDEGQDAQDADVEELAAGVRRISVEDWRAARPLLERRHTDPVCGKGAGVASFGLDTGGHVPRMAASSPGPGRRSPAV